MRWLPRLRRGETHDPRPGTGPVPGTGLTPGHAHWRRLPPLAPTVRRPPLTAAVSIGVFAADRLRPLVLAPGRTSPAVRRGPDPSEHPCPPGASGAPAVEPVTGRVTGLIAVRAEAPPEQEPVAPRPARARGRAPEPVPVTERTPAAEQPPTVPRLAPRVLAAPGPRPSLVEARDEYVGDPVPDATPIASSAWLRMVESYRPPWATGAGADSPATPGAVPPTPEGGASWTSAAAAAPPQPTRDAPAAAPRVRRASLAESRRLGLGNPLRPPTAPDTRPPADPPAGSPDPAEARAQPPEPAQAPGPAASSASAPGIDRAVVRSPRSTSGESPVRPHRRTPVPEAHAPEAHVPEAPGPGLAAPVTKPVPPMPVPPEPVPPEPVPPKPVPPMPVPPEPVPPKPVPPEPVPPSPGTSSSAAPRPVSPLPVRPVYRFVPGGRPTRATATVPRRTTPAPAPGAPADSPVPQPRRPAPAPPPTGAAPGELVDAVWRTHGVDVSDVPVHRGPEAEVEARALGARAFTRGGEVFLPADEGPLDQPVARGLLAHELTHAAQQRALGSALPGEDSDAGTALEAAAVATERWARGLGAAPAAGSASWTAPWTAPRHPAPTGGVQRQVGDVTGMPGPTPAPPAAPPGGTPSMPRQPEEPAPEGAARREPAEPEPVPGAPAPFDAELASVRDRLIELSGRRPLDLDDPGDIDEVAVRVYQKIHTRLRRELLVDRERAGRLSETGPFGRAR